MDFRILHLLTLALPAFRRVDGHRVVNQVADRLDLDMVHQRLDHLFGGVDRVPRRWGDQRWCLYGHDSDVVVWEEHQNLDIPVTLPGYL